MTPRIPVEILKPPVPRYPRPKILLIDMRDESEAVLKAEGYNVRSGSFGVPYQVPKNDTFEPVIINGQVPIFTEQEIIVIDLAPAKPLPWPKGEKHTSPGERDWWASCTNGIIDPRPRLMVGVRLAFDRILSHGGVFIIFADMRYLQKMKMAYKYKGYGTLEGDEVILADNWCFLSILHRGNLEVALDHGEEISVLEKYPRIAQILSRHVTGGSFQCILRPTHRIARHWITLAENKYSAPVAGAIAEAEGHGWVFIFPRLRERHLLLARFLKDVLPDLAPRLFPHLEGARWVERPEYELPRVLELKNKIIQIQKEVREQVTVLEGAIGKERTAMAYLHDLIRETGRPMVIAVNKTLDLLGFRSVVDVDEEMKRNGDAGPKREDLQVHDKSPVLLVEVKGISGLPSDAGALQAVKYVAPRMKEWNRTDVQGLAIINHQRNLPALERDNKAPFREDILTNAKEQSFGLLTAWDLFRLVRSFLKHGWKHEHIKGLFYQVGRIDPVPTHYRFIGTVEKFWEKPGAVGVRIEAEGLTQGDRIAFELPVEFEEQRVESLQVDRNSVTHVEIGALAGIKTHLTGEQLRKGVRVFRAVE